MTDDAFRQLMKHAHRLAMDGHGELAQMLRDTLMDARRYRWLRDGGGAMSTRWSRWRIEHWASPNPTWTDVRGTDLDAAIDAALGETHER